MDKSRLEKLKEKNRMYIKRKHWEENELFQNCLRTLKDVQLLECENDSKRIANSMCELFPINEFRHIDGSVELSIEDLDFGTNQVYYVVWDNADLPVIKCFGKSFLEHLDDLFAVDFDTYIFNDNFTEIIHSDESSRLWRYFS